jgi:hypothetical protein
MFDFITGLLGVISCGIAAVALWRNEYAKAAAYMAYAIYFKLMLA